MGVARTLGERSRHVADKSVPRDIAVFIDGTWNEGRAGAPTNVLKLYEATRSGRIDGRVQVKLYIPGVGRKPASLGEGLRDEEYQALLALQLRHELPAALSRARAAIGGVFGKGTTARIKAAYQAICDEFVRERGDRVFVFGFSRGAFAARSLSGFMERVGLLLREHTGKVERAYELYESGQDASQSELANYLHELTGQTIRGIDDDFWLPVHFLGVWDTVASLGLPSRLRCLSAPFTEYHQVDVPPNVMHARHGLALHELRSPFEPLLWRPGTHASLEQVWFPGAHSDVGGGYPEGETGLSDEALMWMAAEAENKGLALDRSSYWLHPVACPPSIHLAARGLFTEVMPRPRAWLESGTADARDTFHFHSSARDYLCSSLAPAYDFRQWWVNSALRKVDDLAAARMVLSRLNGNRIVQTLEHSA